MQYWDDILYPSFRATIRGEYYGIITQDDMDEECYHLACRAISTFKFPKISLDYKTFYAIRQDDNTLEEVDETEYPEAIPHGYFENNISHKEVEVLIAWMKVYWHENLLSNADNFEDLYTDVNIKTFSRANLIDKNTNVLKDARKTAERMESRYSRVNSAHRPALGDVNNE
jgi:hypothetical protein